MVFVRGTMNDFDEGDVLFRKDCNECNHPSESVNKHMLIPTAGDSPNPAHARKKLKHQDDTESRSDGVKTNTDITPSSLHYQNEISDTMPFTPDMFDTNHKGSPPLNIRTGNSSPICHPCDNVPSPRCVAHEYRYEGWERHREMLGLLQFLDTVKGARYVQSYCGQKHLMTLIVEHLNATAQVNELSPNRELAYEVFLILVREIKRNPQREELIDASMCQMLVSLLNSRYSRERYYVKFIIHGIYRSCKLYRKVIREAIQNELLAFVYEGGSHDGVKDMLEIYECIICGFSSPVKEIHIFLLTKIIIPLHKPAEIGEYYKELICCVERFAEKDPQVVFLIIKGLMKIWPWRDSQKQILLLDEIEILMRLLPKDSESLQFQFGRFLSRIIDGENNNFKVVHKVLHLWYDDTIRENFLGKHAWKLLPIIYNSLVKTTSHWNAKVSELARSVLEYYKERDSCTYEFCTCENEIAQNSKALVHSRRKREWEILECKQSSSR